MIAFYNKRLKGFYANTDPDTGEIRVFHDNQPYTSGLVIRFFADQSEEVARIACNLENKKVWVAIHFDRRTFFDIAKVQLMAEELDLPKRKKKVTRKKTKK